MDGIVEIPMEAPNEQPDQEDFKSALADHIVQKMSTKYEDFHDLYSRKWLDFYYDYIGQYRTGKEPKESWRTKSYFKFTKVKILSAASQIITAANANTERVSCATKDGNQEAAHRMKDKINAQLEFAQLNEKLCTSAMDMLLYGTFHLQAPAVVTHLSKEWQGKLDLYKFAMALRNPMAAMRDPASLMRWEPVFTEQKKPTIYNRNIFEMYPDPYATGSGDGEGIFHRPLLSEYELADLRGKEGFDKEIIDHLLKLGPSVLGTAKDGVDEKLSARGWSGGTREGYDLHFYTGKVSSSYLRNSNIPGFENAYGYQEVWAWIIKHSSGNFLIKGAPSPLTGRSRPFFSAVFERVPYESQGVGVAENMKDLSAILNGSVRLYMDAKKMAMPMLAVDKTRMAIPGQTLTLKPLAVWQFKGNPKDAVFPVSFPEISTAADGLMGMIELAERYADEITQIPKWTTGINSKMVNKTAKGLSMLMSSQNQLMQTAVGNIDIVLRQIAEAFYDHNMEHDDDMRAKGNMDIVVNGLSAVMAKEVLTQKLLQMISLVINPQVAQNPYALKMLRMVGDNQGIKDVDSVLPKPEELEAFLKEKAAREALAQAQNISRPPGAPEPGQGGPPMMPPPIQVGAPGMAQSASAPAAIAQGSGVTQ